MTWLVTGGAGYIGAHVVRALVAGGDKLVILDDMSTGVPERVPDGTPLERGSVINTAFVHHVLNEYDVTGVVHIAAKKQVGESMEQPLKYYEENVAGLISLLKACRQHGVDRFVFSSSAAVYGLPDAQFVTEETPPQPLSPYGESKLVGEWLLKASERAYGIRCIVLRYFNVAGAAANELGDVGTFNLIPMVFERLEAGQAPRVFGEDYPTDDGTCVRDFVHVADIAEAHLAATRALDAGHGGNTYNVGRGEGASVLEVIRAVAEVTGIDTPPVVTERRPGDPARVVANVDRVRNELGIAARYSLADMVQSAWTARQSRRALEDGTRFQ